MWCALNGEHKGFASACGASGVVSPSKMGRFRVDEAACNRRSCAAHGGGNRTQQEEGSDLNNSGQITYECTLPCDRVRATFAVLETTMASR